MADQIDRELLRRASTHINTLAERAKEQHDLYVGNHKAAWTRKQFYNRYAWLSRLAGEVLEVAND